MKAYYTLSERIDSKEEILARLNIDSNKVKNVSRQDYLDACLDNFLAYIQSIYTIEYL